MVRQVNLYDAKTNLSQLVEDAAKGEEIVIAKNGKPLAKLVEISPKQDSKSGKRIGGQWAKLMTPKERAYHLSDQFKRDWKAMDAEIERDFYAGFDEEKRGYDQKWDSTSSIPTPSSISKTSPRRSAKKREKR